MSLELTLPPTVDSVGAGRRFVDQALSQWDLADLSYTAMLLTSEVLTNSVLHARTPILLTIERIAPAAVTISVHDSSQYVPRRRRHAQDATTGRGIELLDRLAPSWQVHTEQSGKTLSFTVSGDVDPWAEFAGDNWAEADLS
jgi:anti-sigma regulatory factor (Ser/Thr protein kinase)